LGESELLFIQEDLSNSAEETFLKGEYWS